MSSRQAHAHIDLDAIAHNFGLVTEKFPDSKVMAVIKADAYGHGAVKVAQKLKQADAFAVARVSEAVKLREAGVGQPICLLEGVMDAEDINYASMYEFQVVIHSEYQLDLLQHAGALRQVWLKVDTGMGRLGIRMEELPHILSRLGKQKLLGLMTHLSDASNPASPKTREQLERIHALSAQAGLPALRVLNVANSAGIIAHPATATQWVRPGLMLYGASPMDNGLPIDALFPAMTFFAPVIAVKTVKQGESVGYGGIWTAERDTRIAVIAAGYADGYPRETRPGTPVLIHGVRRPLIGRVSMDMICVALEPEDAVDAGDNAVLWGEGLPVEEIAGHAGTIAYTLLSGVSSRVGRIYRGAAHG